MRPAAMLLLTAAALVCAGQVQAAQVAPRPVVEGVAQAVADNYKAEADSGAYGAVEIVQVDDRMAMKRGSRFRRGAAS